MFLLYPIDPSITKLHKIYIFFKIVFNFGERNYERKKNIIVGCDSHDYNAFFNFFAPYVQLLQNLLLRLQ